MKPYRLLPLVVVLSLAAFGASMRAQPGAIASQGGQVGLGLALRQLGTVGVFLQGTGHPDDENSALLALLVQGQGMRAAVLTATRGTGGQNEIGPELFEALSVLRTSELASVHRYDGAEQYFARAIDFGYSFSVDETFRKWGRQEILSDYVRMIRTIRPDVIVTMSPDGEQGGAHHQAQARIMGEAFRLAADPQSFPEQIKGGLRAWQPRKLYYQGGFGGRGGPPAPAAGATQGQVRAATDVYDPLLGQTYSEIGSIARSQHKCQGMGQLLALPGGGGGFSYRLGDTTLPGGAGRADQGLFDGIDTTLAGLASLAGASAPDGLKAGLAAIAVQVDNAQRAFKTQGPDATLQPIVAGLGAVRALRARLASLGLDEAARFEIDSRLKLKEEQFQHAAVLAQGIRVDVLADDGVVFAGQPVRVQTIVANRGAADITVKKVSFTGFDGDPSCATATVKAGAVMPRCDAAARIPATARPTTPYWRPLPDAARYEFDADAPFGLPFRPTPFVASIELTIGGADVLIQQPVEYRYEGNIFSGEKRMELLVVPRFSVSVTPEIAIVPTASLPVPSARPAYNGGGAVHLMELRVVVVNGNKGAAKAEVSLDLPNGWKAFPAVAPVEFAREDAAETVRFKVAPASGAKPGQYDVKALVRSGAESFDQGYQVIEYPHIRRQHLVLPAHAAIKVIDVRVAPGLSVGYVMGVGDQVPPAIAQLGARVTLLDADALAWGNLSGYDAIVTGVRAYERRADLRANNRRLLEYASNGGTLIVQYNKSEFNEAQYGPYPARVGSGRVTDETAPIEVLVPANPIFTFPNAIGAATWKDWVQERGLYFLGEKDAQYVDLVQLQDPFPANAGMKRGALVEAKVGKGRWIYVGLGLWRQLPAGTDGAYQLLANLLSAGKAPSKQ